MGMTMSAVVFPVLLTIMIHYQNAPHNDTSGIHVCQFGLFTCHRALKEVVKAAIDIYFANANEPLTV